MAGHTGLNGLIQPDLQEAIQGWFRYLESEKRFSAHTLRAYTGDLRQFITYLSGHLGETVALKDLSDAALRDFRGYLSRKAMQGNGSATRARALSSLRAFYKWLDRNGILHNPQISLMATPKQAHKVPRPLEAPRIFDMLETIEGDWTNLRDKALLAMLYGMGLRIGEGLGLKISDIDHWPEILRIKGKGNKEREVPTLEAIKPLLDNYRKACPYPETPERPLFLGEKGKKLNAGLVQKRMRALRLSLGLGESATPHAMRHSYATHLLGEGLNLREIQTLLGHASLSTTQRYTEVDYKQLLETFKKAHPRA